MHGPLRDILVPGVVRREDLERGEDPIGLRRVEHHRLRDLRHRGRSRASHRSSGDLLPAAPRRRSRIAMRRDQDQRRTQPQQDRFRSTVSWLDSRTTAMMTRSDVMVDQCDRTRQGATGRASAFSSRFSRSRPGGAGRPGVGLGSSPASRPGQPVDVHQQLLDLAARQEAQRRARFAAVTSKADLEALQTSLRETFLGLLDGLPEKPGVPPVQNDGTIEADDYVDREARLRELPRLFRVGPALQAEEDRGRPCRASSAPAAIRRPARRRGTYQILHINLAKRGYVVLTYDPVGQGERSQFWDAEKRPVALQPELRRTRRAGQPALPARAPAWPATGSGTACAGWTT